MCTGDTSNPFLSVVADGVANDILAIHEYIEIKPELHYQFTSVNSNTSIGCNTPLLLAVKNGDEATACRITPYYNALQLMHYDSNGHTALHLACYLKLNGVVIGILERAEELGCKEDLLRQESALGFNAYDLYAAPFEEPRHHDRYTIISGVKVLIVGNWRNDKILNYSETIRKHQFNHKKHGGPIENTILDRLTKSSEQFNYLKKGSIYFSMFDYIKRRVELTSTNESVVINDEQSCRYSLAEGLIRNKEWMLLKTLLSEHPGILLIVEHTWERKRNSTLLFQFAKYCDGTEICREISELMFVHSNWQKRNCSPGNTPLLQALEVGNEHSTRLMLEFIARKPELQQMYTSVNSVKTEKYCNTPLLIAIKNGDQVTACYLIPYYQPEELMFYDNNAQTALHLACYLKLNQVVSAILAQAEILGCKEEILQQLNAYRFNAFELYDSTIHEPFAEIKNYTTEIGRYRFNQEQHSNSPVMDLAESLKPKSPDFDYRKNKFSSCFFSQAELRDLRLNREVMLLEESNKSIVITSSSITL